MKLVCGGVDALCTTNKILKVLTNHYSPRHYETIYTHVIHYLVIYLCILLD
jgi:hypothetical protein